MFLSLYTKLQSLRTELRDSEEGATAVEYGLIVALIAAVIVALVYTVGQEVMTGFQTVVTELQK